MAQRLLKRADGYAFTIVPGSQFSPTQLPSPWMGVSATGLPWLTKAGRSVTPRRTTLPVPEPRSVR